MKNLKKRTNSDSLFRFFCPLDLEEIRVLCLFTLLQNGSCFVQRPHPPSTFCWKDHCVPVRRVDKVLGTGSSVMIRLCAAVERGFSKQWNASPAAKVGVVVGESWAWMLTAFPVPHVVGVEERCPTFSTLHSLVVQLLVRPPASLLLYFLSCRIHLLL